MATVDVARNRVVQPSFANPFRTVVKWLAHRRAERSRRIALHSLLLMPEHRLRDMGISHDELIRALEHRR